MNANKAFNFTCVKPPESSKTTTKPENTDRLKDETAKFGTKRDSYQVRT